VPSARLRAAVSYAVEPNQLIRLQRMPTTAGKLSNGQNFNPGKQE